MRRTFAFLLALLALTASNVSTTYAQGILPAALTKPVPESLKDLQDIESHVQKLVERVLPATVCLRLAGAQGSGVIVDRDGTVLTAGHVTMDADRDVTVILHDNSKLKGRTLGVNNGIDSGMVKITDRADFAFAPVAKSVELKKGQWCLALGHPGGLKPGRPPVVRVGRIQSITETTIVTDCALVGGDSGGPLFDMYGRVIGIHSRIGGKVSSNVHVPIGTYNDTWPRLARGEVWGNPFPFLVIFKPAEAYFGVRAIGEKNRLKIESVTPGSPADLAGLRANDIILKLDTTAPANSDELGAFLKSRRPGNTVSVHLQRGNQTLQINVVLGQRQR